MGYLFADLLGIEVLPAEVLRLGENVRKAVVTAKDGESALKNGASAKKSRLRKKAERRTRHSRRASRQRFETSNPPPRWHAQIC